MHLVLQLVAVYMNSSMDLLAGYVAVSAAVVVCVLQHKRLKTAGIAYEISPMYLYRGYHWELLSRHAGGSVCLHLGGTEPKSC
jgi:hypothetical protein